MTLDGPLPAGIEARHFVFPMDDDGCVRNPCDTSRIPVHWQAAIQAVADALPALCGPDFSLYMRGSAAQGRCEDAVSDLDFFLILEQPVDTEMLETLEADICRDYPFVTSVELQETTRNAVPKSWLMALQTQSVLVAGVAHDSPPIRYRPGPDMAVHIFNLRDSMLRFRAGYRDGSPTLQLGWLQWWAKNLLRAGFELVMARCGVYSRELVTCYRYFAQVYPERGAAMALALELAIFPERLERDHQDRLSNLANFIHQEMIIHMGDVFFARGGFG